MREIKYKQYPENSKPHYWGFFDGMFIGPMTSSGLNLPSYQYTGLNDKNGKEIYEGDIVKTDSGNKQVIFNAPSFDLDDYDNGDYYQGGDPYCHRWNEFEVIGNIHETPELLEGKS